MVHRAADSREEIGFRRPPTRRTTPHETLDSRPVRRCRHNAGHLNIPCGPVLYVLRGAVGTAACSYCLCDVDSNGTVAASDALKLLQKAVGQNVSLTCPTNDSLCVNCSNTNADSNAETISGIVHLATDPNGKLGKPLVTFNCSGTVPITAGRKDNEASQENPGDAKGDDPEVRAAGMVIDGIGLDNQPITFALTPACYDVCFGYCALNSSKRCSGFGQCENDGPCCNAANGSGSCADLWPIPSPRTYVTTYTENNVTLASGLLAGPILESNSLCSGTKNLGTTTAGGKILFRDYPDVQGRRFLKIKAPNVTVRNMTITGFGDGIEFADKDGTVDAVTFDRQCDDSISTTRGVGYGAVVQNSTIKSGVDKCVHVRKGQNTPYTPTVSAECALPADSAGTPPNRDCYHLSIYNTDLQDCYVPVGVTAGTDIHEGGNNAQVYISNAVATEVTATNTDASVFACGGSDFAGNPTIADLVDYHSTGCNAGLTFGGDNSKFRVKGKPTEPYSTIRDSEIAGVVSTATGTAKPVLRNTYLFDNGGYVANTPESGGVVIRAQSNFDGGLDDSSNKGGNKINCNKRKPSSSSSNANVYNASGKNIKFQGNNWGADTNVKVDVGSGSSTNVDLTITNPFTTGTSNTCTSR